MAVDRRRPGLHPALRVQAPLPDRVLYVGVPRAVRGSGCGLARRPAAGPAPPWPASRRWWRDPSGSPTAWWSASSTRRTPATTTSSTPRRPRCDRLTVVVAPSSPESIPLGTALRLAARAAPRASRSVGVVRRPSRSTTPIRRSGTRTAPSSGAGRRPRPGGRRVQLRGRTGTSWPDGSGPGMWRGPGPRRVPVSGTAVRADPAGALALLSAPVRACLARRVVVVGAESTGTTTMARALAGALRRTAAWVPEYGRELTARKLARAARYRPGRGGLRRPLGPRATSSTVARRAERAPRTPPPGRGPGAVLRHRRPRHRRLEERYLGAPSPEVRAPAATAVPLAAHRPRRGAVRGRRAA